MDLDEARRVLEEGGLEIKEEKPLSNGYGTQLKLKGAVTVNVYTSGKVQVQGNAKAREPIEALLALGEQPASPASTTKKKPKGKVFVVYGHDTTSRTQLEAILLRWGLEPLILEQLPTVGQTVIEKLEAAIDEAHFGIVLATPDDEGHRAGHPDEKKFRVRQNVVMELGMLLTKLGRERVAILHKDQDKTERPSDIQGLIYFPFTDDVAETRISLAKCLSAAGYDIKVDKL